MVAAKKTRGLSWGKTSTFADLLALFEEESAGLGSQHENFQNSANTALSYYLARLKPLHLMRFGLGACPHGAMATLMKQSPAHRLSEYNDLLDACADRGELAAVLAIVKKLKRSPDKNDRAKAVLHGFERAARSALKRESTFSH